MLASATRVTIAMVLVFTIISSKCREGNDRSGRLVPSCAASRGWLQPLGDLRDGGAATARGGLYRRPGLASSDDHVADRGIALHVLRAAFVEAFSLRFGLALSSNIPLIASNMRVVNSSVAFAAIVHDVGRSRATTRMRRVASSAFSRSQSAAVRRDRRSTT